MPSLRDLSNLSDFANAPASLTGPAPASMATTPAPALSLRNTLNSPMPGYTGADPAAQYGEDISGGEFSRGLRSSAIDSFQAAPEALLGLGANLVGANNFSNDMLKASQQSSAEAAQIRPFTDSYHDVKDVNSGLNYAAGKAGEIAPFLGAAAATAPFGGAPGIAGAIARGAGGAGLMGVTGAGGVVQQHIGADGQLDVDPGKLAAVAGAKGAADAAMGAVPIGRLLGGEVPGAIRGALTHGATMGAVGTGMGVTGQAAETALNPNRDKSHDTDQLIEGAIGGVVGILPFGAISGKIAKGVPPAVLEKIEALKKNRAVESGSTDLTVIDDAMKKAQTERDNAPEGPLKDTFAKIFGALKDEYDKRMGNGALNEAGEQFKKDGDHESFFKNAFKKPEDTQDGQDAAFLRTGAADAKNIDEIRETFAKQKETVEKYRADFEKDKPGVDATPQAVADWLQQRADGTVRNQVEQAMGNLKEQILGATKGFRSSRDAMKKAADAAAPEDGKKYSHQAVDRTKIEDALWDELKPEITKAEGAPDTVKRFANMLATLKQHMEVSKEAGQEVHPGELLRSGLFDMASKLFTEPDRALKAAGIDIPAPRRAAQDAGNLNSFLNSRISPQAEKHMTAEHRRMLGEAIDKFITDGLRETTGNRKDEQLKQTRFMENLSAVFGTEAKARQVLDHYSTRYEKEFGGREVYENRSDGKRELSSDDVKVEKEDPTHGISERDAPTATDYIFQNRSRGRGFADKKAAQAKLEQLRGAPESGGFTDGTRFSLQNMKDHISETGGDHKEAATKLYKDYVKQIKEDERHGKEMVPNSKITRAQRAEATRRFLKNDHGKSTAQEFLAAHNVIKAEGSDPNELRASSRDLQGMRTGVDIVEPKEAKAKAEWDAKRASNFTVHFKDGTKETLNAESVWKTWSSKRGQRTAEDEGPGQYRARMFKEGIAAIMDRPDYEKIEGLKKSTVFDHELGLKIGDREHFESARPTEHLEETDLAHQQRWEDNRDELMAGNRDTDPMLNEHVDADKPRNVDEETGVPLRGQEAVGKTTPSMREPTAKDLPPASDLKKPTRSNIKSGSDKEAPPGDKRVLNPTSDVKGKGASLVEEFPKGVKVADMPAGQEGKLDRRVLNAEKPSLKGQETVMSADAAYRKRQAEREPIDRNGKPYSSVRAMEADRSLIENEQAKREKLLADREARAAYAKERGIEPSELLKLLQENLKANASRLEALNNHLRTEASKERAAAEKERASSAVFKAMRSDHSPEGVEKGAEKADYVKESMQRPSGGMSEKDAQAIRDDVARILGPKIKLAFEKWFDKSGEWDPSKDTITISTLASNARSVGWHEAMHAFLSKLTSEKGPRMMRKTLLDVAESPPIMARLRTLLKDHEQALKDIEGDREERLAYMFQFYKEGLINMGPQGKGVFGKIAEFLRAITGTVSEYEKAGKFMDAIYDGKFADQSIASQVIYDMKVKTLGEKLKETAGPLAKWADVVFTASADRLINTGVDALAEIADGFHRGPGRENGETGLLQKRQMQMGKFLNRFQDIVGDMNAVQHKQLLTEMTEGLPPKSDSGKKLKALLGDMHTYLVEAGVKRGEFNPETREMEYHDLGKIPEYFPQVWSKDNVMRDPEAFKKDVELAFGKGAFPQNFYDTIVKGTGYGELSENEHQPGFTPFNAAVNKRLLKMDAAQRARMEKYLEGDLTKVMSTYMFQATHRAEYTRRFGNDGFKIEALLAKASKQGATKAEIDAARENIKGMEGTLGADMDPKLRKFMAGVMVYENMAVLPFALFGSLTDPIGQVIRGGEWKDARRAFATGIGGIARDLMRMKDKGKDWEMAKTLGLIDEANMLENFGELYNGMYMGRYMRKMNDAFFRYNGLEGWTKRMRTTAMVTAERFLLKHSELISEHSVRYLKELGIEDGDIKATGDGRIAKTQDQGLSAEQERRVQEAIFKWVDGAVVRPNAAHRPVWGSDPHWGLVFHLKQFSFSQNAVINRRVAHEFQHGNFAPAWALAAYAPMMEASDYAQDILAGHGAVSGVSGMFRAISRSGILGKGQFGLDALTDPMFGSVPGQSFLGPAANHAIMAAKTAAGHGSNAHDLLYRSLPAGSALRSYT